MSRLIKSLLCLTMSALILLSAGCGNDSGSSGSELSDTEKNTKNVSEPSNPVDKSKQASIDEFAASADFARIDDSRINYNTLEIKRNIEEIEDTLENYMTLYKFRGAVYTKVGNDFEYHTEKGVANQGAHVENSIYTGFYTGSVTKLFTSVAVMKLVEDNGLSLDTTIDKYFPKCSYAKDVTIKQLLTMTSGIPNYIDRGYIKTLTPSLRESVSGEEDSKELHSIIIKWILSQKRQSEDNSYFFSDSNYYLLGDIIAAESKMSYEEYIEKTILKPVFMTKTSFAANETTACPYISSEQSKLLLNEGMGYSSLGLISNVSDLLRFIDGLMSYQILTADSLLEIFKDYGNGFGYGVFINGNRVSCIGGLDAYSAKLSFSTDRNLIFVALSNYLGSDPNYLHNKFRNYMLKYSN